MCMGRNSGKPATQIYYARQGLITDAMRRVAEREELPPAVVRDEVARGRMVIPTNVNHLAGRLDRDQLLELKIVAPGVTFLVDLSEEEALARAAELDGADAHLLSDDLLAAATNLRFVQSWSAGVDGYLRLVRLRTSERIVLANMQGVHGPAIA